MALESASCAMSAKRTITRTWSQHRDLRRSQKYKTHAEFRLQFHQKGISSPGEARNDDGSKEYVSRFPLRSAKRRARIS